MGAQNQISKSSQQVGDLGDDRMWGVGFCSVLGEENAGFLFFFFFVNKKCCAKGREEQFLVGGKVRARHKNMLLSQCSMGIGVQRDVSGIKRKTVVKLLLNWHIFSFVPAHWYLIRWCRKGLEG